ncbi:hypothetical protein PROFUN_04627 [Planoprotostelium fungivorum]|uniref:Anoctamin dimerisation domain-containing protein n=1 Tax=Planoprotostelium fungivorum TaxID=1890364 RepID=A0A2P6NUK5_9EUKA|nr:hypothetical protein PROFUN_04627 [Planoprotostelium fungivorum]
MVLKGVVTVKSVRTHTVNMHATFKPLNLRSFVPEAFAPKRTEKDRSVDVFGIPNRYPKSKPEEVREQAQLIQLSTTDEEEEEGTKLEGVFSAAMGLNKAQKTLQSETEFPISPAPDPNTVDYEYVIVFDCTPEEERAYREIRMNKQQIPDKLQKIRWKDRIGNKLVKKGLSVLLVRSQNEYEHIQYMLVSAPDALLEATAEFIRLELPVKESYGGGFSAFTRTSKDMFETIEDPDKREVEESNIQMDDEAPDIEEDAQFFSSVQQQMLIRHIMEGENHMGGANLDLDERRHEGHILEYFPVHHDKQREWLFKNWTKAGPRWQPIDEIRKYFGEYTALFFAYMEFSTYYLIAAAAVGVPCFIAGMAKDSDWPGTIYSIFLAVWATIFLNFWKRYNSKLNWSWNMMEFSNKESPRAGFYGTKSKGFETDGVWVAWEDIGSYQQRLLNATETKYYPKTRRIIRLTSAMIPLTLMCVGLCIITIAIMSLRIYLTKRLSSLGGYVGSAVNAITILALNQVYKYLAYYLTEWENHRTQTGFDNWLIIKSFIFQFVNSYVSLYYIAFFKNGAKLWGSDDLSDKCASDQQENPISGGCLNELTIQLGTILVINTISNQFTSIILPFGINFGKILWRNRGNIIHTMGDRPKWEKETELVDDVGVIDKYSQLVIQYGYIVLFAAAFPLAPLIALLNNLLNIRSYSAQMLKLNNRPHYRGAKDIGVWYWILELLGAMGVITNCLIIGYTHRAFIGWLGTPLAVLVAIVVLEHILMVAKLVVEVAIPDVPHDVRASIAIKELIEEQVYAEMNHRRIKSDDPTRRNAHLEVLKQKGKV